MQGLATDELYLALGDVETRKFWLTEVLSELRQINLDVDKKLLSGSDVQLMDLCARRRAYQDILEGILRAKRITAQPQNHNPQSRPMIDLDRVTA